MRARHVVILNWRDLWHPEGGGSELYVQQVAQRLHEAGSHVTIFSARYPRSASREIREGIEYVRRGGHLTVYLWAAALMLTGRFGRVDAVLEGQNGMPFLARLHARCRVVVLVHHVHREQWPVVGPVLSRIGWFIESRVAVRVNRGCSYIAVSDVTRGELAGLGVRADDIRVACNGVPPAPARPKVMPSATPRLVVLSRLVPHKRIEHAIDTVAALRQEFSDVELVVMGSGWWGKSLLEHTARQGVVDRVRFLGHVSDETKLRELAASWVLLMPSLKEGWGLSIIEAATMGVPSVAYRSAGGVQESIQDGVTGLLADGYPQFVDSVRDLLHDAELRRSLGAKAAVRAEQYDWDVTVRVVGQALLE